MPLIDKHAWYITISCIWYNLYPNIIVFIYYNNLMNSSIQINQININTTKHWFKWTKIDVPFFQFQIQIPYWQIYLMPWCASHWEMMTQQSPTDLRFIYRYKSSFTTQIENLISSNDPTNCHDSTVTFLIIADQMTPSLNFLLYSVTDDTGIFC